MNMLLPLAVVCVDAFLLVLWLAAMAGTAAKGGISDNECTFYIDSYYLTYWKSKPCEASKGSFVMELLIMCVKSEFPRTYKFADGLIAQDPLHCDDRLRFNHSAPLPI